MHEFIIFRKFSDLRILSLNGALMPFFSVQRSFFGRLRIARAADYSLPCRCARAIQSTLRWKDSRTEYSTNHTCESSMSGNDYRGRHGSGTTGKRELSVIAIACRARSRYARKKSDAKIIHETRRCPPVQRCRLFLSYHIEKATFVSPIFPSRH